MTEFDELVQQVIDCTRCSLCQKRMTAVPGEGARTADIVYIGEGPGYHEDRQGRPFVGPAGRLLDELLASIGLNRSDVYITNMVKCRPPNNRDPLPEEIEACKPYLDRQLDMIEPKIVVTLGRHSFTRFFPEESISKARGKPRTHNGVTLYPMYHPAAALHNPKLRPIIERDFQNLQSLLNETSVSSGEAEEEQPEQLSLFQ